MTITTKAIATQRIRLRHAIRSNKLSPQGKPSLGYGLRMGYWPCLQAPYLQIAIHRWRVEVWRGLPSYRGGGR